MRLPGGVESGPGAEKNEQGNGQYLLHQYLLLSFELG
jgi:hypothetical protein